MSNENTSASNKNDSPVNFESAMVELEALVSKIETGNLSLEDSLKEFQDFTVESE